ncbi:Inner membrane protein YbaL [Rubripirellula lacrimiformis]|uniref:Inner membrane protein YbaL n=1 Tax=Rubripirellula lacrimiformis TaxID=1930273 RepID=A0A517NKA8_9BACT|nr:cation:proton antiporter [Rubripirellula lacrimiformis]QDT07577.1 Inner membrane protein YbaL [Rubripirellula lacrimiformis]
MTETLIHNLLIILSAGLLAAVVCRRLNVSVLIGYLVVGAVLGQGVLGWVSDGDHQLEQFAEAGVFLLLFSIGLEFSLDDLKRLGRNLVIGGAAQMLLVALPLIALLMWLGMEWASAVLIASAVAFSSTVLVFKTLSEWGQSEQPHGRRAIGILLFQDAALVPLLLLVPLLTGGSESIDAIAFVRLGLISFVFVVAVLGLRMLLARWVIPLFAAYRSPELIILFTIVLLGAVTLAAYRVGLPPAVGAFAAGLIFNGNRWTRQIDALVLPFRETFAAVFFVGLGLIFDPRLVWQDPVWMGAALVSVIALKAVAATISLWLTGMTIQRAFGMGLGLAHIGEFAFVLVLLGFESSVIAEADYRRVVAIAVGSLVLAPPLMKFGLRMVRAENFSDDTQVMSGHDSLTHRVAVVIGAGPIGTRLASQLETMGKEVCLLDLSPINLHPFAQLGFRTVAGDATDSMVLARSGVGEAYLVVVCVPDDQIALQVVRAIRKLNSSAQMLVRCRYQANVGRLRKAGAAQIVTEETEASLALLESLRSLDADPNFRGRDSG